VAPFAPQGGEEIVGLVLDVPEGLDGFRGRDGLERLEGLLDAGGKVIDARAQLDIEDPVLDDDQDPVPRTEDLREEVVDGRPDGLLVVEDVEDEQEQPGGRPSRVIPAVACVRRGEAMARETDSKRVMSCLTPFSKTSKSPRTRSRTGAPLRRTRTGTSTSVTVTSSFGRCCPGPDGAKAMRATAPRRTAAQRRPRASPGPGRPSELIGLMLRAVP
jgi:hypothetical protein